MNTSDYIPEAFIPEACVTCIYQALGDTASKKITVDTYDKGLAAARDYVGDEALPADEFDRWQDIGMRFPEQGPIRSVVISSGFDLGLNYGESYVKGSETQVIDLEFDCPREDQA